VSTVPFTRARNMPLPSDIAKRLPSNIEAEKVVLGAILMAAAKNPEAKDNAALKAARELITPTDFFPENSANGRIFRNMLYLADTQQPIELIPLIDNLEKNSELDAAGGGSYISSLTDGLQAHVNVAYYARLVKEKATLRELIRATQRIQHAAIEQSEHTDKILADAGAELAEIQKPRTENPAVVVGFKSLLTMEIPDLEYAITPLLTTGGTGEIYGWRGAGKSLVATEAAYAMSTGAATLFPSVTPNCGGGWPILRAYRLLYVYGEMHGAMIKERAKQIAAGHGAEPPSDEFFGTMCKDFQKAWRPNISTPRNRRIIEERIFSGGYEGLILDNISTLWPTSQEGEGERSAVLNEWFIELNQRGIWVIWLHHAGKSGEQRGSSEKEDILDFVVRLKNPPNYKRKEGLRVEVALEKVRGECTKQPRLLMPFELSLVSDRGAAVWVTRPARNANLEAAFDLFGNGGKAGDAQMDLKLSRATAFRYYKKFQQNPHVQNWLNDHDEED